MAETKQINWFPGHMAKATKNIQESLKNVDLIIEVVDARAVNATSNYDFCKTNKLHLKIGLKSDLADLNQNQDVLFGSTKDKSFRKTLLNKINEVLAPLVQKQKAKGIAKPTFYIMVVGLPNVGKSSLINLLAGKKAAIVGNKPAVTLNQSVIKITDTLFLQDNPGVFFKKVESIEQGYVLALLNTIKKEILPLNDVVNYCFSFLQKKYPSLLIKAYGEIGNLPYVEFKKAYANKRHFTTSGNMPDDVRTVSTLFDEFVNGQIGKINYEK